MKWLASLTVAVALGLAACDTPCSAGTCSGCCVQGVCYLQGCGTGGGSTHTGGGASATGGGAAGGGCASSGSSCASKACCAFDSSGDPLRCAAGYCENACKMTGSCASSAECCPSPNDAFGTYCQLSSNSCVSCAHIGRECYQLATYCCPGLRCASKPATPNFYECLQ